MDIFLNRLIQFYLNNTINLRRLTQHIISCYTHKMAIVSWPYTLWRYFTLCINYDRVLIRRAAIISLTGRLRGSKKVLHGAACRLEPRITPSGSAAAAALAADEHSRIPRYADSRRYISVLAAGADRCTQCMQMSTRHVAHRLLALSTFSLK